jgi:murein DD-endopeptidase MepM/ murein hydrolase activator NlpD
LHRVFHFSGLVAVGVVLTVGGFAQAQSATSHDLDHRASDVRARAAQARADEGALAGDIAAQSERIDAVEVEIGSLSGELAELEGQLNRSRTRLRAIDAEVAEKTRTLARARAEVKIAQRHLSGRLVDIYTSNEPDALAVVLGAESLEELIDLLDMQSRVLESDAALVDQIKALRERVTAERARATRLRRARAAETAAIEHRTDDRRAALQSLVARRDALASLRSARQRSLASVQVQRREWEEQADALQAESARVASLVATTPPPAAPAAPASSSSSGFVWPVGGTVVSPYGQRWGRLHAGIDIAAPAGAPVVASASGQVVYAGSMSGYGLLVVIQHAGGIATAYAHNSSISVSVGQSVGQGQTIAAVGCTGHCFGDHVHFEVRVGGSPVDPMGYL